MILCLGLLSCTELRIVCVQKLFTLPVSVKRLAVKTRLIVLWAMN